MNCGRSHALELLLESLPELTTVSVPVGEHVLAETLDVPVDVVLVGEEVTAVVNPEPLPIRQVDDLAAPVSKKSKS